jgi:hypothetical protein
MKFFTQCLLALSIFTALISASPLTRRTPSRTPSPTGNDNVFLVYYRSMGGVAARHWAIFVTASAAVQGATGAIYQVSDDRYAPAHLKPNSIPVVKASDASIYEGSVYLGRINAQYFKHYNDENAILMRDLIAQHNAKPANFMTQSNCQHWVYNMISPLTDAGLLPGATNAIAHAPR